MQKVLILLSAPDEERITEAGQTLLRDFRISYQLRVGSAQLAAAYVQDTITSFQNAGGQVIICVAEAQDQLASLAAAACTVPVLNVLVSSHSLAGGPWPGPLPVANLGAGEPGFTQAVLFVLQLLALQDQELAQNVQRLRHSLAARLIAADHKHRVSFDA